jgi:hypothetical protein
VLDEIKEIDPQQPQALNNRAVALYAFGASIDIDTMGQADDLLESVLRNHADFADPYFNLAAIQAQRGRNAAARKAWQQFLDVEPSGGYADFARSKLDPENSKVIAKTAVRKDISSIRIQAPVPLGPLTNDTLKKLQVMKKTDFNLGSFTGRIYYGKEEKLLVIDDVVEMVETVLDQAVDMTSFKEQCGEPFRSILRPDGSTLIYPDFAADVIDGQVRNIVYFEE